MTSQPFVARHFVAPRLTASDLRRLLGRAASSDQVSRDDVLGDVVGDEADLGGARPLVPAAVLVPFVLGPAPGVLLTRRGAALSSHAGQVSFPGGRIDAGDRDAEAAALREAHEEIGLDPDRVEVVGRLCDYVTISGFRVTPVVGLLPEGVAFEALGLSASPTEVAAMFELPLAVLLDPQAPQRQQAVSRGRDRTFWVWPHPQHYIWGATAAILVNLAARLRAEAPPCSA